MSNILIFHLVKIVFIISVNKIYCFLQINFLRFFSFFLVTLKDFCNTIVSIESFVKLIRNIFFLIPLSNNYNFIEPCSLSANILIYVLN